MCGPTRTTWLWSQRGPIVRGYDSGISIGLAIPDSIVDFIPQRDDPNVSCEYRVHGYDEQ